MKTDLVFLVDSSRSICGSDQQCSEWQDILNFVNSVINQLNVGRDHTRIGFVRYSSRSATSNEFYLNSNQFDRNQVTNAVSAVDYNTGRSIVGDLANAFQVARTQQFVSNRGDRFDADNVIIALVNGGVTVNSPDVSIYITLFIILAIKLGYSNIYNIYGVSVQVPRCQISTIFIR